MATKQECKTRAIRDLSFEVRWGEVDFLVFLSKGKQKKQNKEKQKQLSIANIYLIYGILFIFQIYHFFMVIMIIIIIKSRKPKSYFFASSKSYWSSSASSKSYFPIHICCQQFLAAGTSDLVACRHAPPFMKLTRIHARTLKDTP